jgi:hypothetical protein
MAPLSLRKHLRTATLLAFIAVGGFLLFSRMDENIHLAQAVDDEAAPLISEIKIKSVTATSSLITWITNENSDSIVNFGVTKNYGVAREANPSVKSHEVFVSDLEPATTYHYRVVSSDAAGNQSFSGSYTFTTPSSKPVPGIEKVERQEERTAVEKISELIDKVSDKDALEIIQDKVQSVGEGVLTPPTIIGDPNLEIGADTVTVRWRTDKEANGIIEFATEAEFSGGNYARQEGNADELSTNHEVVLHGLRELTTYHYRITSKPSIGPEGQSEDKTFLTKSTLPQISAARIVKVEEDSATISWTTQVPAAALVEYTNLNTRETKSIGNPSFQASHTIRLPDLKFKSPYSVIIKSRTQAGDEVTGQPLTFVTAKDDAPPIISQVANESTLYPGADAKVQTIVSWDTDEAASCQFFFTPGLTVDEDAAMSAPEETGTLTKHVQVITEFTPSTVYKFWVRCRDRAGNAARSEDFVLFTPEKEKNIIDIILENFEGTFGWVKNIGK